MEYIPPENRDTRYALWFIRYPVRVPLIQTKSIEELEEHGLPTAGDPHHDHAMQWEPILLTLPIHRIADLWNSGANISLVRVDDAVKIYEAINAHLQEWKHHILNSYNPIKPPYDDLLILDNFANVIYQHAKPAYDSTFIQQHFKMASATAIGRRAMLSSMRRITQNRIDNEEKGILNVKNIDYKPAVPRYDPEAEADFIDYSGKNKVIDAPERQSLAKFFKKVN